VKNNSWHVRIWNIWFWPQLIGIPFVLLSTLGFYFSPNPIAFFAPFALIFPVIIIWILFWTIISILRLKSASILGIVIIGLSYPQWKGLANIHRPEEISNSTFKIASWNVHHWRNINWTDPYSTEIKMSNWMLGINPDILCLQENESKTSAFEILRDSFPYETARKDERLTIYSKYPIIQWDFEQYYSDYPGHRGFIWADIELSDPDGNIDTIRITNIHLVTTTFDKNNALKTNEKLGFSRSIYNSFKSLTKTAKKRNEQLEQILEWKNHSKHPVFIAGDFNELPTSNAYYRATQEMIDAFAISGSGIGSTFKNLWEIPLRIDWILCPKESILQSTKQFDQEWSDHNPVIIEISPFVFNN
tara:strand:+ start:942 stop:2021 length:1080 start_codon:yes stop_codon:yes gene_type:complete